MLFWRLATAGLSLSFVTPYVNAALQDAVPGYQVAVGDTELFWQGLDAPVGVIASDVRVAATGADSAVTIPRLHLDFAAAALLRGELSLTRVEADGALLNLTRNAGGELGLAVTPSDSTEGGPPGEPSMQLEAEDPGRLAAGADPERASMLAHIAGELLQAPRDQASRDGGTLAGLEAVGVTGSRLIVDDAVTGRSWQADNVRIAAERGDTGIVLRGAMDLDLGDGRRLPVSLTGFHRRGSNAIDARVAGGPVYPAELATGGDDDWLQTVDAPLLFEAGFRFDGSGLPAVIDGRITGAVGRLRLPSTMAETLPLSDLDLRFRLHPRTKRFDVTRLSVNVAGAPLTGQGGMTWSGTALEPLVPEGLVEAATAPRLQSVEWRGRVGPVRGVSLRDGRLHVTTDGVPEPPSGLPSAMVALDSPLDLTLSYQAAGDRAGVLRAEAAVAGARLDLPAYFDHPLSLADLAVGLRYDAAAGRLDVGHAALQADGVAASFNGSLDLAVPGAAEDGVGAGQPWRHLSLEGDFGSMTLKQLLALWPKPFAAITRDWFAANLEQAQFQAPRIEVDMSAADLAAGDLPEDSIDLRFGLADAVLHYLRPMSPIRGMSGEGRLTQDAFTLSDAAGTLDGMRISDGAVTIARLQEPLPLADIRYRIEGAIAGMLALLGQKPLELPQRTGLDPAAVGGNAGLDVSLAFPLREGLDMTDISYGIAGPLSGVEMRDVIGDIDLSRGALQVSADRNGLDAKGEGRLAGVPAGIEWRQPFDGGDPARFRIRARLDDLQRARWGVDLEPFVTGPVGADLTFLERGGGSWEMGASLDLEAARLAVPALHLDKPAGMPATAALRGEVGPDGVSALSVDNLVGPGLGVTAQVSLTDGAVSRVDLPRLEIGASNMSGWAQANPNGIWSVFLQGAQADLRPYLDGMADGVDAEGPAGRRAPPPTGVSADLVLNVSRAIITDDFVTTDLAMEVGLRDGLIERLQGQAVLPAEPATGSADGTGPGTIRLRAARDGQSLRFALNSDDAGGSFRSIGFDKMRGGSLVAVGTAPVSDPGRISARAVVQDTRIVDVPELEALVSDPAARDAAGAPAGSGVPVEVAEMEVALEGATLLVRELRARGPGIGITLQGEIGLEVDRAALTGTFVPAYALNNAFGEIPIIGDLLIGREGEGLIGFTFRVSGPLDAPDVEVNPLSGLAPGFLRRIFEFTPPNLSGPDG